MERKEDDLKTVELSLLLPTVLQKDRKEKWIRGTGPKKDIISVKEREQQVLNSVPINYRKDLVKLIKEYQGIFPEKLVKGVPPKG